MNRTAAGISTFSFLFILSFDFILANIQHGFALFDAHIAYLFYFRYKKNTIENPHNFPCHTTKYSKKKTQTTVLFFSFYFITNNSFILYEFVCFIFYISSCCVFAHCSHSIQKKTAPFYLMLSLFLLA